MTDESYEKWPIEHDANGENFVCTACGMKLVRHEGTTSPYWDHWEPYPTAIVECRFSNRAVAWGKPVAA